MCCIDRLSVDKIHKLPAGGAQAHAEHARNNAQQTYAKDGVDFHAITKVFTVHYTEGDICLRDDACGIREVVNQGNFPEYLALLNAGDLFVFHVFVLFVHTDAAFNQYAQVTVAFPFMENSCFCRDVISRHVIRKDINVLA